MLLLPILFACMPPEPVDFGDPAQLAPLDPDNQAPPAEVGGGLSMVSGELDDYYWAHARALFDADPAQVWEALRDVDVIVDRRAVSEYTWEDNVKPEFDFSFVVHNTVRDPITVNFDLTWVHELHAGEISAPDEVVIRWDKTDGTQFIRLLSGSAVLTRVNDQTELQLIEHLGSATSDEQIIEQYFEDLYNNVQATLAGAQLPTY